jgi:hypothetical protein
MKTQAKEGAETPSRAFIDVSIRLGRNALLFC